MKKTIFIAIALSIFINIPQVAYAQIGRLDPPIVTTIPLNATISRFINFAIGSGVLVFFFLLVWGSLSWVVSQGDKAALGAARSRITTAFIGLLLLTCSFIIFKIISVLTFGTQ